MAAKRPGSFPRLPTIKKERVWHIGNPTARRRKVSRSLEGTLLSVSEHPVAWSKIAKLGGRLFMLSRSDGNVGVFVDRHSISERAERTILSHSGLVTTTKVYVLSEEVSDEDGDGVRESVYATLEAAEREADQDAIEDGYVSITERDGWAPKKVLLDRWKRVFSGSLDPSLVADFALMEAVEGTGLYDGMWWRDDLDPWSLSAPRGGIFQTKLHEWSFVEEGNPGYVESDEGWDG